MKEVTRSPDGRWSNADADRIALEPYDRAWAEQFESEAAALRAVLPADLEALIEHIGSTAVPGLAAKPIIDILLGADRARGWERIVAPVTSLGYVFWAENPRTDHMFFVKGMPPFGSRRTHHVHVLEVGDEFRARLAFRDHLRAHPAEARRYEALKREVAARFATDRDAYTDAKSGYVAEVVARALAG